VTVTRKPQRRPARSRFTIRGRWLLGGYADGWQQRPYIETRIADGQVFLAGEDLDMGGPTCPLRLDTDGHIAVWGINTTFAPRASDMKRIKRIGGFFA
jgi:hypothetical protein